MLLLSKWISTRTLSALREVLQLVPIILFLGGMVSVVLFGLINISLWQTITIISGLIALVIQTKRKF